MHTRRAKLAVSFALASLLCLGPRAARAGPVLQIGDESWLRINYEMQLYGAWRDTGSGPDGTGDTTDVFFRRNRLTFIGQVIDRVGFVASFQFQGDQRIQPLVVSAQPMRSFDALDAFVTVNAHQAFNLRAGLTKDPLVRELNEGCFFPLSVDRSLFAYTPLRRLNRDFGVVAWGNAVGSRFQYRVAAMKGNDDASDPESSLRYTARAHVTLLDPEDSLVYRGTYLGEKKVFTVGAGYQFERNAVYGNVAAATMAKSYRAWTVDGFVEYPFPAAGTITASGAYLHTDFDGAYQGGDPDPRSFGIDGEKKGWYVKAGYLLPVDLGGGKLQVFGRVERWDFAALSGIVDQQIRWVAGGVNYYLRGQDLRITLEVARNDFATEDATSRDFTTVTAMLQLLL